MWQKLKTIYNLIKTANKIFSSSKASSLTSSVTNLWGNTGKVARAVMSYSTNSGFAVTYSDIESVDSDFWEYCRSLGYVPDDMSHYQCVEVYKQYVAKQFSDETGYTEEDLDESISYIGKWINRNSK